MNEESPLLLKAVSIFLQPQSCAILSCSGQDTQRADRAHPQAISSWSQVPELGLLPPSQLPPLGDCPLRRPQALQIKLNNQQQDMPMGEGGEDW